MAGEGHAKMIVLVWLAGCRARSSCVGDKDRVEPQKPFLDVYRVFITGQVQSTSQRGQSSASLLSGPQRAGHQSVSRQRSYQRHCSARLSSARLSSARPARSRRQVKRGK